MRGIKVFLDLLESTAFKIQSKLPRSVIPNVHLKCSAQAFSPRRLPLPYLGAPQSEICPSKQFFQIYLILGVQKKMEQSYSITACLSRLLPLPYVRIRVHTSSQTIASVVSCHWVQ